MNETKRQELPGPGLWVIATPIGNLGDLTPRARAAIEAATAVLCEDTRRTSRLTTALGLHAKLERFDAHSGKERVTELVERLAAGESLALVTDAGTPGISDPAAVLVAAARAAGIGVTPFPGASAVTTLLSVAGFNETAFAFRGFFPRKQGDRIRELAIAGASEAARVFVWYESPERIVESLEVFAEKLPGAQLFVAKELTKLHERFFSGSALEAAERVREEIAREGAVGEWCFAASLGVLESVESSDWVKALQILLDVPLSASDAAKRVSQVFGVAKNTVYEAALRLSGKK